MTRWSLFSIPSVLHMLLNVYHKSPLFPQTSLNLYSGSIRNPLPSISNSWIAPVSVATTGIPHAIASRIGIPNPSALEVDK